MKKIIPWMLATAVIMLVFPWLAVTFIKGDGGMAVCFILFFAVNPIYAICSGAYAGKDIKIFWPLPIITALFFLLGTWLFFSIGEKAFILYVFGYLLLGIVAELISMFVKKKILNPETNFAAFSLKIANNTPIIRNGITKIIHDQNPIFIIHTSASNSHLYFCLF